MFPRFIENTNKNNKKSIVIIKKKNLIQQKKYINLNAPHISSNPPVKRKKAEDIIITSKGRSDTNIMRTETHSLNNY